MINNQVIAAELACAPTNNGPGVTFERSEHECQVLAGSSSHNLMHKNATTLSHSHDPEAPPTYSEAVAAP